MKKWVMVVICLWVMSLVKFFFIMQEQEKLERLYSEAEQELADWRMEQLGIPPWDILIAPSYNVRLHSNGKTERSYRK